MSRPDLSKIPVWYHGYINLVDGNDPVLAMKKQTPALIRYLRLIPADKRNYRYAKGKWTIQEMFQHLIDSERVFAYRALCIARKETVNLPGFDENEYADNSKANKRNWNDLVAEMQAVRQSTILLFESFDKVQMRSVGKANGNPVSVLAIGFILTGHVTHHIKVIRERYL